MVASCTEGRVDGVATLTDLLLKGDPKGGRGRCGWKGACCVAAGVDFVVCTELLELCKEEWLA